MHPLRRLNNATCGARARLLHGVRRNPEMFYSEGISFRQVSRLEWFVRGWWLRRFARRSKWAPPPGPGPGDPSGDRVPRTPRPAAPASAAALPLPPHEG